MFLGVVVPAATLILTPSGPKPTQPHIVAPAYAWPAGCTNKAYRLGDSISRARAKPVYIFRDWKAYGLPYTMGSPDYYRIGNDAVLIQCGFFKNCQVRSVTEDAFYQNSSL